MTAASPRKMALIESQLDYERGRRVAAENYASGLESQLEEIISSQPVKHEEAEAPSEHKAPAVSKAPKKVSSKRPTGTAKAKRVIVTKSGKIDRRTKAGKAAYEKEQREAERAARIEQEQSARTDSPSPFSNAGKLTV